jgi:hypothetical protein
MSFRIILICIVLSAQMVSAESGLVGIPKSLREYYIQKAKVWQQKEIASADILAGPQSNIAVPPEQEVTCSYVEGREEGYAPKFKCKLAGSEEIVFVKYKSRETFAEIAASRLLWALGFYADENYPVKLKCMGCPATDPSQPSAEQARRERIFEDAIIERNFPGEIGEYPDQGWDWKELDEIQLEGATKEEIDALKLLAVFMQHTDSKREQQRLGCYSKDIHQEDKSATCKQPVLMIQDLGATFGKGASSVTSISSMTFNAWKNQSIWNAKKEAEFEADHPDQPVCFGNLVSAEFAWREGFSDPEISEEGRKFLANLLNQLSDQQIHNLFRVARADKTGEMIEDRGVKRMVRIEDWVAVFKEKRRQINERRCS